ncbi:hypothetical protein GCM10010393_01110 [Streptomyces gobitricini]|uniref:Uncharacterized protein n=1 Tax=Streptomyces gobitricini TaxID=68211 RepID=A0ABN3KZJ4_9ACTN
MFEFIAHSLTDLGLRLFGVTFDKVGAARRMAAHRRGEKVVLRCRHRVASEGPAMRRGKLSVTRGGVVLSRAGGTSLRLVAPADVAVTPCEGGSALVCDAVGEGAVELLLPTRDEALLALITDTMAGARA